MKKYLFVFAVLVFALGVNNVLANSLIIDTTSGGEDTSRRFADPSINRLGAGTKFIAPNNLSFGWWDVPLGRADGTFPENVEARLYDTSNNLLTTSSNSLDPSSWTTNCYASGFSACLRRFYFPKISLSSGQTYYLIVAGVNNSYSTADNLGIFATTDSFSSKIRFTPIQSDCGGPETENGFCYEGGDGYNFWGKIWTYDVSNVPYFSKVQNADSWRLRNNPTTSATILRILPKDWTMAVLSTTNDNGNNIEANGYRWYKVKDLTDGQEGWMAAIKLSDSTVYLDYDENAQDDLEAKTVQQGTDTDGTDRIPVIEDALDDYMNSSNTGDSLYNVGGADGNNDFPTFISNESFPRELFLGIISRESGGANFNNRKCGYADDGGIGIMQITTDGFKGLGSGLRDNAKAGADCFGPDYSDYYSNSIQGIYANIKDGFRTLQEKHAATLAKMSGQYWTADCPLTIGSTTLSCNDLKKIVTTWSYNSFSIYDSSGTPNNYLGKVADELNGLSADFSNINSTTANDLRDKFRLANKNKHMIKLHSPGDLSILDSSSNRTGIFDGTQAEEILFSAYDPAEKGVVIFFPSDTYSYSVQGTNTGTYGLTIDNYNDSETPIPVDIQNVPLKPDVIHKYTVDWDEVDSTGDGVHIDVDKDGDGTYEYGFDTIADLDDPTAPTTTSSLAGTSGINGWYTSNVTVTLSASDNAGGTGVLETKYSTDNGTNWNIYSSPFAISSEGTTTLKYYSSDKIGNVESTNTQTIKIDKTAPESRISFDSINGLPKIEGTDNLSVTTVTKVDDSNYTVTDNSGRTLKINLLAVHTTPALTNPAVVNIKVNSLQYDSNPIITLPITNLHYEWLGSPITALNQSAIVLNQFAVSGVYNPVNNTTSIVTIQGGVPTSQTLPGIKVVKLITNAGILSFSY